jgi:2-polyprenyl-6-hydroxyphenyl methylase/3-demethylubiquinone-9 3-methyltransferase
MQRAEGRSMTDRQIEQAAVEPASRYEFGKNWERFSHDVTDRHIAEAIAGLTRLVSDNLRGKTFLDIGCGSGLHALAALRLGAAVTALDIDADSVKTARRLLSTHAPDAGWTVDGRSVFDIPEDGPRYDIVYSWGVLHHTGRMWDAVRQAARLVRPGGQLVIALYRRTPMCPFWRIEKRLYSRSPRWLRAIADGALASLMMAGLLATGRNPVAYVRDYPRARGMTFGTNVRDWLGGYPYESASPAAVHDALTQLGFSRQAFFPCNTRVGLLGAGCDEYVYKRATG